MKYTNKIGKGIVTVGLAGLVTLGIGCRHKTESHPPKPNIIEVSCNYGGSINISKDDYNRASNKKEFIENLCKDLNKTHKKKVKKELEIAQKDLEKKLEQEVTKQETIKQEVLLKPTLYETEAVIEEVQSTNIFYKADSNSQSPITGALNIKYIIAKVQGEKQVFVYPQTNAVIKGNAKIFYYELKDKTIPASSLIKLTRGNDVKVAFDELIKAEGLVEKIEELDLMNTSVESKQVTYDLDKPGEPGIKINGKKIDLNQTKVKIADNVFDENNKTANHSENQNEIEETEIIIIDFRDNNQIQDKKTEIDIDDELQKEIEEELKQIPLEFRTGGGLKVSM
ncbi:hypothetical protein HOK51_04200 [Candidatus Woesearchaeota archaeon]|jgi:hypothetical protein|nr:hypothetical protein [Candidatus Woesearchaeota archaeon]MBT7368777.1 hypothetical protein [Candidatus Woesearchaeota archaeon]